MTKSWSLAVSNGAVALTVLASLFLTQNPWSLIGLAVVPVNIFLWQHGRQGVMVVSYEEDDEITVTLDTTGENKRGNHQRPAGSGVPDRGDRDGSSLPSKL